MEENEELVDMTENVEETTEETVEEEPIEEIETQEEEPQEIPEEMFTQDQVNEMVSKRLARKEAKIRKEYARKYGRLETVVNAGLETKNIDEAVEKLTDFYTKRGINIPNEPQYSDKDLEVLARDDADEIISGGYEDIVDEVDRLAQIGAENMTQRDKLVFVRLSNERKRMEDLKELATIGVNLDDLSDDFKEYESKLNPNLSIKEKYEMYLEKQPKKEIKQIGSMKSGQAPEKEYYTDNEISKMTLDDLDKPGVWEKVRNSMTKKG